VTQRIKIVDVSILAPAVDETGIEETSKPLFCRDFAAEIEARNVSGPEKRHPADGSEDLGVPVHIESKGTLWISYCSGLGHRSPQSGGNRIFEVEPAGTTYKCGARTAYRAILEGIAMIVGFTDIASPHAYEHYLLMAALASKDSARRHVEMQCL